MNTIRSTWMGWGVLCVAGGGAYYYAKKSINAERTSRYEADVRRKSQLMAQESEYRRQTSHQPISPADDPSLQRANLTRHSARDDDMASPSTEAARDPAPTRHEPDTETERVLEKGKYETAEPYRPPKGNRFV